MKGSLQLLLIQAAFLAIALPWLARPGLEYDEAYFVNPALVTSSGSAAEPHDFVYQSVTVLGHRIPVRTFAYMGALKAWLWAPIFAWFGVSPTTIRLPALLLSLVTIWLVWGAARAWLGPRAAALATALVALDPGFLFNVRCDTGPLALAMLCGAMALRALQKALERGSARWLFACSLAIALGFFDKVTFVWTASGLVAAALVLHHGELRAIARGRLLAWTGIAIVGFCYALIGWIAVRGSRAPLGCNWLAKLGACWKGLQGEGLLHEFQTGATYQRSGFLQSLAYDADRLRLAVQGQVEPEALAWLARADLLHGTLLPAFVVAALLLLPFVLRSAAESAPPSARRAGQFVAIACVVDYGLLFIARGSGLPHHFPLGFPYPQLLIAFVLARLPRVLALGAGALQLALCVVVDARYVASYGYDGGNGSWSDASGRLCAEIQRRHERPVFLDWGMQTQWIVFAGRERPARELAFDPVGASGEIDARARERGLAVVRDGIVEELERGDGSVFVTWEQRWEWYPSLGLLREEARARGLHVESAGAIPQRDGRPAYELWRVRR